MRLIDLSEVINEIERFKGYLDEDMMLRIKIAINRLPTIDAEPIKVGHWIEKGKGVAECDVCNQQNLYRQDGKGVVTKYCPSCGARMEW